MRSRTGPLLASAALALAAWLLVACAQNLVQVRQNSTNPGQPLVLKRIAVAPFQAMPRSGTTLPPDAASLVAGYVVQAFADRGIDAVPPSDVAQALSASDQAFDLRAALQIARAKFGADALVTGTLYRFRNRSGEAMGSTTPASVGFEVRIYSEPDGKLLWSAVFDHTQVALGANALTAVQYPGGGTRWLTSEELARWGAQELVKNVPLAK